jgi:hypothetical protein
MRGAKKQRRSGGERLLRMTRVQVRKQLAPRNLPRPISLEHAAFALPTGGFLGGGGKTSAARTSSWRTSIQECTCQGCTAIIQNGVGIFPRAARRPSPLAGISSCFFNQHGDAPLREASHGGPTCKGSRSNCTGTRRPLATPPRPHGRSLR